MRPFKVFFGLSLAIMLFFVVARFFVFAFIAAAVMSIIYAVFRRLKDFVTYDSYGAPYFKQHPRYQAMTESNKTGIEPLFYDQAPGRPRMNRGDVHFITIQ